MQYFGHRGCAYEPENTKLAFEKAIALGTDMIETDVKLCRIKKYPSQRELILFHDDKLERTTDGKGIVSEKDIDYLKALDAGKGEHILTLKEGIEYINRRCPLNIEAKDKRTANHTSQIVKKYLRSGWKEDDFLFSSFHRCELEQFYLNLWNVRRSLLLDGPSLEYESFMQKVPLYAVSPRLLWVNEQFVGKAHKDGLKVFVWTVNEQKDIARMEAIGVDGIFTDYPDRRINVP